MLNRITNRLTSFDYRILIEIIIVFTSMRGTKWLADYYQIIGAGSIGIWSGVVVATVLLRPKKISWKDFGLGLPKGKRDWIISLALALLTVVIIFLVMGLVLDPIMTKFGLDIPSSAADRFKFFLGRPLVFIGYLITIVWFGAALGEELLMRGYLLNRLADLIGKTKFGWTVSLLIHAIFFGTLHSYQGLPGIITTAVVALVFGSIYLLTKRRLFPLILAHGIINTISLTAFYLTGGQIQ